MIRNGSLLFLSEGRIDLDKRRNGKRNDAEQHHGDEEMLVAQQVLQPSAGHARQHQSEERDGRAERIVRRLILALRVIEHVKGERGEAQAITKLLHKEARTDEHEVGGQRVTHVNINSIGQGDGANKWP